MAVEVTSVTAVCNSPSRHLLLPIAKDGQNMSHRNAVRKDAENRYLSSRWSVVHVPAKLYDSCLAEYMIFPGSKCYQARGKTYLPTTPTTTLLTTNARKFEDLSCSQACVGISIDGVIFGIPTPRDLTIVKHELTHELLNSPEQRQR